MEGKELGMTMEILKPLVKIKLFNARFFFELKIFYCYFTLRQAPLQRKQQIIMNKSLTFSSMKGLVKNNE